MFITLQYRITMYVYMKIILGWKYIITCIVCEDISHSSDVENNACLKKYR